ncbi:hypothetical protein KP78_20190 [Jeotgalibacillus soli]|uniref:Uncharacterized protein n=2 Tax=Jeotgalibacillus soli TaxID=889306 RepID=A0A0C2R5Y4_9BACL|nr:hypothetical protein KP78_20190 [Jeotgalibacillus soli]
MNGVPFDFMTGLILSVLTTVMIFVLGAIIPAPQAEEH